MCCSALQCVAVLHDERRAHFDKQCTIFIGNPRVWKGGLPHSETKAEIMGRVVKFK